MPLPFSFSLNNEISGDYRTNPQVAQQQVNRAKWLAKAAVKREGKPAARHAPRVTFRRAPKAGK